LGLRVVFFSFYYPPDLCAGSFRAVGLVHALKQRFNEGDELHVITTHPNRYSEHRVTAEDSEVDGSITIHRIAVPIHQSGMLGQSRSFLVFARAALLLCSNICPDFIIGTTGRLMTGVLASYAARRAGCAYFVDLRDIFSETISDLFSRKSVLFGKIVKQILSSVDGLVLGNAAGVNVVSLGFLDYFEMNGMNTGSWTFFPNGVDEEFVGVEPAERDGDQSITTVLYAGNIGRGQGLESVIPSMAKQLGDGFRFVIVGGGGGLQLLKKVILENDVGNIKILPPVSRNELLLYYRGADVLFLHLNDVPAFRRVLPSKIFEYAALGKPIVAGLSGYSEQFMRDHIPFACLFSPGDVKGGVKAVKNAIETEVESTTVNQFVTQYSRVSIMNSMASYLIELMAQKGARNM
jgi:glycosyltransferase involved in cell wall biosynthesis